MSQELSKLQLTQEQEIRAAAQILGYRKLPPTIEEFVTNEYYLGKTFKNSLFPYWMDKLKEIFPTCIHTRYPYIVLTGAIGTGKSTLSKIIALYNRCRLDHLKNLDFFGLAKTKATDFLFFHVNQQKAHQDFVSSIMMIEAASPYFTNGLLSNHYTRYVTDGARSNNGIGGDVIFYNLSEINFINYHIAYAKIDTAHKRFKSRYQRAVGYLGNIIVDTSTQGDDSVADDFIKNNVYEDILSIRASIWEAKAHLNMYFRTGSFDVYCGDAINAPFIITDPYQIKDTMDKERIIKVPMELKADFQMNIITALQDSAGVSTTSTGKYLNDPTLFLESLVINQTHADVIDVDFYDKSDSLYQKLYEQIKLIPTDRILFIRYDIGVTNDLCGLSITYFDNYMTFDDASKGKLKIPQFVTPLKVGISRKVDQETSIFHLEQFIFDLRETYEIGQVTTDQFASRQLIQDLNREGISAKFLSVDRTDISYIYFKNCIMNKSWKGTKNELFKHEIVNLLHEGGKVDHKVGFSKDISDAVVGSVYNCYENLWLAEQPSNKYKVNTQTSIMEELGKSKSAHIQESLNNLFR